MRNDELSKKAYEHVLKMENLCKYDIEQSTKYTHMYQIDTVNSLNENMRGTKVNVSIVDKDVIAATINNKAGKTCVLNFASYKHPGGGFLGGMMAQEEAICHASNLFNVISRFDDSYYKWNREHLNRGLYTNRALYSPNIKIQLDNGEYMCCDVLTCASPNWNAAGRYGKVTREENYSVLLDRVGFILLVAMKENVETLILGALGCGVFRQNPYEVARAFRYWIGRLNVAKKIVFAIPNANSENYKAFYETLKELL